jgi:hypothetical protein
MLNVFLNVDCRHGNFILFHDVMHMTFSTWIRDNIPVNNDIYVHWSTKNVFR